MIEVLLAGTLVALGMLMALLWWRQVQTRNAGLVDVGWAFGVGAAGGVLVVAGSAPMLRKALVAGVLLLWSLRLGGHILRRVLREPQEDSRYAALRARWGAKADARLFGFFQAQALLAWLFALPAGVAAQAGRPVGFLDVLGCAIGLVAIVGECLADVQLAAFKRDPSNGGQVCAVGLWRYSRHPNYFFEWLFWWSFPCFAWGADWAWFTLLAPALMLLFLYRITGIPAAEARSLERRGEAYRRYQRSTSAFFPWFPREHAA